MTTSGTAPDGTAPDSTAPDTTAPDTTAAGPDAAAERDALVERVAAAVLSHPDVVGLHGGRYNDVCSWLPRGRLTGVRLGAAGGPVELGVVLRLHRPIPDVLAELRATVSTLCSGAGVGGAGIDTARVDITVGDVLADSGPEPADPSVPGVATPPTGARPGRMVR